MVFTGYQRLTRGIHVHTRMVALVLCLAIFSCMLGIRAASAQIFATQNSHVRAEVSNEGSGLITIFYFDINNVKQRLSFNPFSFLTIDVDGTYYSNDSYISSGMDWVQGKNVNITPLKGGIDAYRRDLVNHYDTIETTWHIGTNNFDLIQDVYPVVANSSGQIVYKWSIKNYKASSLSAQVQFLLDVETSDASGSNDDPIITTREGYNASPASGDYWHNFTTLPPYFLTSENDICTGPFPGEVAAGYTVDDFAPVPMGLMQPVLMANVDYKTYAALGNPPSVWGYPQSLNNTPMQNDNAILFQWPGNIVGPGTAANPSTIELGRGSYGTAPCVICFGNLDATLLHTERIHWTPSGYFPNHFPVDAIIWNSNSNSTAKSATGTQTIWNTSGSGLPGPVQIISPGPVTGGGYMQQHGLTSGGSMTIDSIINNCRASWINWEDTLIQDKYLINCSTDSEYHIQFTVNASGVSNTNFIQPPQSEGGCSCDIWVDCQEKDVNPPIFSPKKFSGLNSCHNAYICTIDSVHDNRPTDLGLQSLTYSVTPSPNAILVTGIPPTPLSGCPSWVGPITITQKDTLHAPCVILTATDCAGNQSYDTVCFSACPPITLIDTQPPRFWLKQKYNWNVPTDSSCGNKCSDWVVTDTIMVPTGTQRDLGIGSIDLFTDSNMIFTLLHPVTKGMPVDSFSVCVNDSMQDGFIIIKATDAAANPNVAYDTIRYCTVPDTVHPVVSVSSLSVTVPSTVTATDSQAWDRGIKQVMLTAVTNCAPVPAPSKIAITKINATTYQITPVDSCPRIVTFQVAVIDSFQSACFTTQATDCVGNMNNPPTTTCYNALSDIYCPKIDTVTLPGGELSVTISDVHTIGNDTIGYDEGIDSVWFACANNITLDSGSTTWKSNYDSTIKRDTLHTLHGQPTGGTHPKFPKVIQFKLYVTDTLSQSANPPCVCINAVDGAGNGMCGGQIMWCSSVAQDTHPPVVTVTDPACETLAVNATDNQQYDRGVYRIWLDSLSNFVPLDDSMPAGPPTTQTTLQVPNTDQSSFARLSALDLYGQQSTIASVKANHTTSSDLWIYKQDLAMNGSGIADANTRFSVPVYLSTTDAIPLSQKKITQYQFKFHLTGSPLVTFIGTQRPQTLPATWTITPAPMTLPAGPPYVITGQGPALTDAEGTGNDTLVYLVFQAASSSDVEEAKIVIDSEQCGAAVIYNGGIDTTIALANFTATLPAPTGRLNGGTVILKDTCSTIIGDHPVPTILSIEPAKPNPANGLSQVTYTVPAGVEGAPAPVTLELFDAVGRKVLSVVDEAQSQGTYTVQVSTAHLPRGLYFLRLASLGKACFEQLTVE